MASPFWSSSIFRLRYSASSLVRYQTHTRYLPPVESRFQFASSDSTIMELADISFSFVKLEAVLPYSSILPVDSGVFMARYLALSTPVGDTLSGTLKCVVSPSIYVLTVTFCFAVAVEPSTSFTSAA